MFNLGFTHLLILGVIALVVIGPEQLPDMARKLAKLLNELRRAKDEIMAPMTEFHNETQKLINDAQAKANVDIQKLLAMREELDAQIRANQKPDQIQQTTVEPPVANMQNVHTEPFNHPHIEPAAQPIPDEVVDAIATPAKKDPDGKSG